MTDVQNKTITDRLNYLIKKTNGHLDTARFNTHAKPTRGNDFDESLWTLGTLPSFMLLQICEAHQERTARLLNAINSKEANRIHDEAVYITEAMRLFIVYEKKTDDVIVRLEDDVKKAVQRALDAYDKPKDLFCHGIAGQDAEDDWSGERDPVPPLFSPAGMDGAA